MISVFSGFISARDSVIKSIRLALGIVVLFDALIVRIAIVLAAIAPARRVGLWLPR
jgi:putative drug exporter of the RND superfamily